MSAAPRWITALYPGRCRKCWGEFWKGETIRYYPASKAALCLPCGKEDEGARPPRGNATEGKRT